MASRIGHHVCKSSMNDFSSGRKDFARHCCTCDQQQQLTSALAVALDYAAQGCAVFPCHPRSKEPATKRGFKDATKNPATIRRWYLAQPDYNVGLATGAASRVMVLDVDGSAGAETLLDLEERYGALPDTACSVTGAGCHLWFQIDDMVPSTVGRVGVGLDIRADGGYIIAPPSVHPDGSAYRWSNSTPRAPAPPWLVLLGRTRQRAVPPVQHVSRPYQGLAEAYGRAALEAEIHALAQAAPGTRNHELNRASFYLFQLVAGGELDGDVVRDRLIAAAQANGLMTDPSDGPTSVERTIASGARAGLQRPRSRRGAG